MTHWTDLLDADGPDGAYLPWKKVEPRVGISRTTAWRLQKAGEFPKPYVVSPGRVAFRESEVEAWKASRAHRAAVVPKPPPSKSAASKQSASASQTWAAPKAPGAPEFALLATPTPASPPPVTKPGQARRKATHTDQMNFDF